MIDWFMLAIADAGIGLWSLRWLHFRSRVLLCKSASASTRNFLGSFCTTRASVLIDLRSPCSYLCRAERHVETSNLKMYAAARRLTAAARLPALALSFAALFGSTNVSVSAHSLTPAALAAMCVTH